MNREHTVCVCGNTEHLLFSTYDEEDNAVSLEIHLTNYKNIFQRTWVALKYIFGYKSKYGNFDNIILDKTNCQSLLEHLNKIKE